MFLYDMVYSIRHDGIWALFVYDVCVTVCIVVGYNGILIYGTVVVCMYFILLTVKRGSFVVGVAYRVSITRKFPRFHPP